MERYQVILAYDGTDFKGYQRQGGARTVQAVIETALRSLGWQGRAVLSAGRTDTGVHAAGQVVSFDLDWAHEPQALGRALNAALPPDVSVMQVGQVQPDFHPRYGALARTYRYCIYCQDARDPLRNRYAWRVEPPLLDSLLEQSASLLVGTHDFAAFGSPPKRGASTVRTVFSASWEPGVQPDEREFWVTGNAFLYHMVRRMVFLQVQAARGKLSLDDIAMEVSGAEMKNPGLAPPNGLTLMNVHYPTDKQEPDRLRMNLAASGENGSGKNVRN